MPTAKELKDRCRELGFKNFSSLRKSELEEILNEYDLAHPNYILLIRGNKLLYIPERHRYFLINNMKCIWTNMQFGDEESYMKREVAKGYLEVMVDTLRDIVEPEWIGCKGGPGLSNPPGPVIEVIHLNPDMISKSWLKEDLGPK